MIKSNCKIKEKRLWDLLFFAFDLMLVVNNFAEIVCRPLYRSVVAKSDSRLRARNGNSL